MTADAHRTSRVNPTTANEANALAAMYDGLGAIARQLEQAADALDALARPVDLADVRALVRDATEHVGRAWYVAAELRRDYA